MSALARACRASEADGPQRHGRCNRAVPSIRRRGRESLQSDGTRQAQSTNAECRLEAWREQLSAGVLEREVPLVALHLLHQHLGRQIEVAGVERADHRVRLFDQVGILSQKSPKKEMATLGPYFVAEYKPGSEVRLSRNPYFSSLEKEARVPSPDWKVTGLSEGRFYWVVQSVDARGKESIESEKNGFTIVSKGNENVTLPLDLEPFIQHSHVIEVKGKTQQGARVMVNGEQVPVINDDGSFTFFTPALPTGESMITVTAQNEKGGVATLTKRVVIQ